jgi:hypothetical protein
VPGVRSSTRETELEATKSPAASWVHSFWSAAVRSGTQDLSWAGLTPITLADDPLALTCAPSKVIIFLTPLIPRRPAMSALVRPVGMTISRSGRTMPL